MKAFYLRTNDKAGCDHTIKVTTDEGVKEYRIVADDPHEDLKMYEVAADGTQTLVAPTAPDDEEDELYEQIYMALEDIVCEANNYNFADGVYERPAN